MPPSLLSRDLLLMRVPAGAGVKDEDFNAKSDSQFASHLKSNTGASAFSRSKTLKEQREYLPAFACREDLMRTIRDNQGASSLSVFDEVFRAHSQITQSQSSLEKLGQAKRPSWDSSYGRRATAVTALSDARSLVVSPQ